MNTGCKKCARIALTPTNLRTKEALWICSPLPLRQQLRLLASHSHSEMSKSQGRIVEGLFAINKPSSISSAQVIRNLQRIFNPSNLFVPWLKAERANRDLEYHYQRKRRNHKRIQVKIGHGGTLDPMATGVLILGVGQGTKQLQNFLECTKSYEATILFGAATDTYDTLGKVLKRATYQHVDRKKVDQALQQFRGEIMQRPPIYSALRMDGKRLYEYAREGKDIPREIERRPVEVMELEIIEWYDGGSHGYNIPEEHAETESKILAEKVLHFEDSATDPNKRKGTCEGKLDSNAKRKRSLDDFEDDIVKKKKPALSQEDTDPRTLMSGGLQSPVGNETTDSSSKSPETSEDRNPERFEAMHQQPPAVKLRMTVTSGFYVRSLAHDLGEAVGSLACMSALVRTRQGYFELGRNVLEYENLGKGEDVWGPKIMALIQAPEKDQKILHIVADEANQETAIENVEKL